MNLLDSVAAPVTSPPCPHRAREGWGNLRWLELMKGSAGARLSQRHPEAPAFLPAGRGMSRGTLLRSGRSPSFGNIEPKSGDGPACSRLISQFESCAHPARAFCGRVGLPRARQSACSYVKLVRYHSQRCYQRMNLLASVAAPVKSAQLPAQSAGRVGKPPVQNW